MINIILTILTYYGFGILIVGGINLLLFNNWFTGRNIAEFKERLALASVVGLAWPFAVIMYGLYLKE